MIVVELFVQFNINISVHAVKTLQQKRPYGKNWDSKPHLYTISVLVNHLLETLWATWGLRGYLLLTIVKYIIE